MNEKLTEHTGKKTDTVRRRTLIISDKVRSNIFYSQCVCQGYELELNSYRKCEVHTNVKKCFSDRKMLRGKGRLGLHC